MEHARWLESVLKLEIIGEEIEKWFHGMEIVIAGGDYKLLKWVESKRENIFNKQKSIECKR